MAVSSDQDLPHTARICVVAPKLVKHKLVNGNIWQGRVVAACFPTLEPGCPCHRNLLTIKLEVYGMPLKELGVDLGVEHFYLYMDKRRNKTFPVLH